MTVTAEPLGSARVVRWEQAGRLNAWTRETIEAIADAIEAAGADEGVRSIVVRGAGEHFSAGDDLHAALVASADDVGRHDRRLPARHARHVRRAGPGPRRDRRRLHRRRARVRRELRPAHRDRPRAVRHARGRDRARRHQRRHAAPARDPRRDRGARAAAHRRAARRRTGRCATTSSARSSRRARSTSASRRGRPASTRSRATAVARTKAMLNARLGDLLGAAMDREERACVELFDGPDARDGARGLREPAPLRAVTMLPGGARAVHHRPRHPVPVGVRARGQRAGSPRRRRARRPWAPCPDRRAVGLAGPRARGAGAPSTPASSCPTTAPRGCSPSARRCRRCPGARAPGRPCRSTSRARSRSCSTTAASTSATSTSRSRRAWRASALRHSRALNVGTFHAPTERVVSTQVARKVVQLVFGRLDARTASFEATARAAAALLPRRLPDRRARRRRRSPRRPPARRAGHDRVRRRGGARRRCACSCARCAASTPASTGRAVVHSARGPSSSTPLRADLRERVAFVADGDEAALLASADILVAASDGAAPQPGLVAARPGGGRRPARQPPAGLRGGHRRRRERRRSSRSATPTPWPPASRT